MPIRQPNEASACYLNHRLMSVSHHLHDKHIAVTLSSHWWASKTHACVYGGPQHCLIACGHYSEVKSICFFLKMLQLLRAGALCGQLQRQ